MHIYLEAKDLGDCSNCGAKKLPHRVCLECGFYKGKKVLEVESGDKKKGKEGEEEGGSAITGGALDFRKLSKKQ